MEKMKIKLSETESFYNTCERSVECPSEDPYCRHHLWGLQG